MSYHGLSIDQIVGLAERGNATAIAAVAGLVENHSELIDLDNNVVLMLRIVQSVFRSHKQV
ncbi:hypothetical protein GCM10017044_19390 [Kordiimonas sediminis]|uniref:Uncharacterized protein n=2 Tax=Kordiimonas sediminis TaxID=1735581 RepID=A0A919E8C3_9PROT|nr:hypothetical protein GCM10017044_19390 [Kordiimonas sediminis]